MRHRTFCSLFALVVLALICGNAYAQDVEQTRNSLRGLSGVYVVPENPLEEDAIRGGLSQDTIRKEAELKLRLRGFVFSQEKNGRKNQEDPTCRYGQKF